MGRRKLKFHDFVDLIAYFFGVMGFGLILTFLMDKHIIWYINYLRVIVAVIMFFIALCFIGYSINLRKKGK